MAAAAAAAAAGDMGAAAGLLPLRESSEAIRQLRRNATGALEQVRRWLALLRRRLLHSIVKGGWCCTAGCSALFLFGGRGHCSCPVCSGMSIPHSTLCSP